MSNRRLIALQRVSTPGQIKGHGPSRQEEEEIRAYVQETGDLIVDTWFVQETATIFDRPQFQACLLRGIELCERGEVDGLILGSVDRLSRDPFDGGSICRDALRAGLRLLFAAEQLDASKEEHQQAIIGALSAARAYARRLKKQTVPARRDRAKNGMIPNGQVRWPFQYNPVTGRAESIPMRVVWVRRWLEILRSGGSLGEISKQMLDARIPAPMGGPVWGRSTIRRILSDPALKGEFCFNYERMESSVFWEKSKRVTAQPELIYADKDNAIFTDEEWVEVQAVLTRNKDLSPKNTQRDYSPLHKLVSCRCGRKLGAYTHHKGGRYFRCGVCRSGDINVDKLWNAVREWLIEWINSSDGVASELTGALRDPSTKQTLEGEILLLKDEIATLEHSIIRAWRIGSHLTSREDRSVSIIKELEESKFKATVGMEVKSSMLNNLAEAENDLSRIMGIIDQFRVALPLKADAEWRKLMLILGLTVTLLSQEPKILVHIRVNSTPNELNIDGSRRSFSHVCGGFAALPS